MIGMLLIGAGLGFALEAAGFGNPRKLTGVFRLEDWAVPQVMMTAILTAMGGGVLLSLFGVDTAAWFTPPTQYAGQALGGFVFGIGFYLGGYCPGTSIVGAASGRLDAPAFMAGLVGGWFVWDAIRGHAKGLLQRAPRDADTLPEIFGLEPRLLAALFVAAGAAVIVPLALRSRRT
jgi:hypothetical protein